MAILEKIRNFMLDDVSGSVSTEWTTLTALLTAAAVSTLGTFSAGVHLAAYVIEADITAIETIENIGGTGGETETGNNSGVLG